MCHNEGLLLMQFIESRLLAKYHKASLGFCLIPGYPIIVKIGSLIIFVIVIHFVHIKN